MDESHAMQVRYVVDRRLIFDLVVAVEQIDACAREPSLRKRTISVSGYHMPDHASLSMIDNLVLWTLNPTRSCVSQWQTCRRGDPLRGDENSLIDFRTPIPFNGHPYAAYRCPTYPARGAKRHERAHNPLPARLHRFP